MVSFVMCPLVVVPAVVGYYYGKHTEQELRDQEQHDALWYLGKEETLHDYNTTAVIPLHSSAPRSVQSARSSSSSPSVEGEEIDFEMAAAVTAAAGAATTTTTTTTAAGERSSPVLSLDKKVQEHPREQPSERQHQQQHDHGDKECREAAAAAAGEAVASIVETRDVEVSTTATERTVVVGTTEVFEEVEVVDDFVLASEIASEELAKLSSAAVAATDLCRTSFVKAVDGAAQELRRFEQSLGGVLAGATASCTASSLSTSPSKLDATTTTAAAATTKDIDKTASFRTTSSRQKDKNEASSSFQHQQDDVSLINFEMVKNPTMEEDDDDDDKLNKENTNNNNTGGDIMLLHKNVIVKAVHKSVRDLELTYKTMTSASLVEI
jgi:hypothetical protein